MKFSQFGSLSSLGLLEVIKSIIWRCRIFSNSTQLNSLECKFRVPSATNFVRPSKFFILNRKKKHFKLFLKFLKRTKFQKPYCCWLQGAIVVDIFLGQADCLSHFFEVSRALASHSILGFRSKLNWRNRFYIIPNSY